MSEKQKSQNGLSKKALLKIIENIDANRRHRSQSGDSLKQKQAIKTKFIYSSEKNL